MLATLRKHSDTVVFRAIISIPAHHKTQYYTKNVCRVISTHTHKYTSKSANETP